MGTWQVVGRHKFVVEEDVIHWNVCGAISGYELTTIFEEGSRVQSVHGYALFCINVTGDWAFPAEARQALAQFHRTHKAIGATAIVGMGANTVMFVDVVLRGVAKVTGHRPRTRFFDALQEAGVWLGDERVRLRESVRVQK